MVTQVSGELDALLAGADIETSRAQITSQKDTTAPIPSK